MTRRYSGCAFFMITSTTMVLLILVDTTWPIFVLRRPACGLFSVSAIYFFLALDLVLVLVLAFLAGAAPLALTAALATAAGSAASTAGVAAAWALWTMPSCFSRLTV